MKIKESKNLKYDKIPKLTDSFDEYNVFEPRFCMLVRFNRTDGKLELNFKNGSRVVVMAKNTGGETEIELIAEKLPDFIGKSYEEILETDF
jgi:hypothetical protein